MFLSSPPPCLQGDPGKQGDPGRDVSTSEEGGFRLCSCWGHQACKGSVPRFLVQGSATRPSPVPSTVPLPVTLPAPRAGCGRRVPCCLVLHHLLSLQGLPGLRGEQGPPGPVGPLGPPGLPVSTCKPPCSLGTHPVPCPPWIPAGSIHGAYLVPSSPSMHLEAPVRSRHWLLVSLAGG